MPFATTHILVAIILVELFREYVIKDKRKFPRYYILIAAVGSILPDLDIALYYGTYFLGFGLEQIHRTFMHTLFIPLILFVGGLVVMRIGIKNSMFGKRHLTLHTTLFILAAGSILHLFLDAIFSGEIFLFYPLINFSVGLNLLGFFPEDWSNLIYPTLDGILLLFWIFWLEFKVKVRNYF